MRTHHWNALSGVIFLLIALYVLSRAGDVYAGVAIASSFLASAVSFFVAWRDYARDRESTNDD